MQTAWSLSFLITLYAHWGWVWQCLAEWWIKGALWFRAFKRKIPLRSSSMATWHKYGHHIWTHVQINKSSFHHSGRNNVSWTKFFSPQDNQDLPSFHSHSRHSTL